MITQIECDVLNSLLQERLFPQYRDVINELKYSIKVSRYGNEYIAIEFSFIKRDSLLNNDFWYDLVYYVKMLGITIPDYIMYNRTDSLYKQIY
jgi:hypothetical protein